MFREVRTGAVDGAVLGAEALALRYFGAGGDRLVLTNLGPDIALGVPPEPLLAAPADSITISAQLKWEEL